MEEIVLHHVNKDGNTISYDFTVSDGLKQYFADEPFVIEYPVDISTVPDAMAVIPFVSNVLPIVWLTDAVLKVTELDKTFSDSIVNMKKGYMAMYPECHFAGEVKVGKITETVWPDTGRTAAFFSGGLDSVHMLIGVLDQKPDLISIWGSDIHPDNTAGWKAMHDGIEEYAQKFCLPDIQIRSTFRQFDNEAAADQQFCAQMKKGWWVGVKHGMALLSHAVPYAYTEKISRVYIAASNSIHGRTPNRCASDPTIDNHFRFGSCKVIHADYEFSRQEKVKNVVNYANEAHLSLPLHVCWIEQTGVNCGKCEKCYRTMVGLLAEGGKLEDFGFPDAANSLVNFKSCLIYDRNLKPSLHDEWNDIRDAVIAHREQLRKMPCWKDIKWLETLDPEHVDRIKLPLYNRIGEGLQEKAPELYEALRSIKRRIAGQI